MRSTACLMLVLAGCSHPLWSTRVDLGDAAPARILARRTVFVASITCGLRACPEPERLARVVAEEVRARGWQAARASDPVAPDVMVLRLNVRTEERRYRQGGGSSWQRTGSRVVWDSSKTAHVVSTYELRRDKGRVVHSGSVGFSVVIEDPAVDPHAGERVLMRVHLERRGAIFDEEIVREAVRRALAQVPSSP